MCGSLVVLLVITKGVVSGFSVKMGMDRLLFKVEEQRFYSDGGGGDSLWSRFNKIITISVHLPMQTKQVNQKMKIFFVIYFLFYFFNLGFAYFVGDVTLWWHVNL